jgi:hypothetical protein
MHNPNEVLYIGDRIPALSPVLLIFLLILNLWNLYGSIKRRLGYDEYLSSSNNEYFKIDHDPESVTSQNTSNSDSKEEIVANKKNTDNA